ncbi:MULTISPECIES: sigma-70 family RNA polymerase sigma factor [Pontibacillus]|uniref:Sigma-70 family RNA polymerase sigma factor n=1 Tax=Pontibacillus chungwhensis TaxID=265426 RepID=A0ABY8V790_9BACI|nr:sigma-70 family RNA polymerase sigma factor [Pontibacillus chungwhensis]MCD5322430.1 sigma-70 family RNA polymerase sigma factor [Pontibacillus sp. HN14]WIF99716.1 sigma-70 family RNA polymerase sigma factor [Pontibacillus chungwhensis]
MNLIKEVKRARKGNKASFEALIREYKTTMYRVSKTILKQDEDCADALQEAILKAFHSIHTLKEPKYFKTWLIRIVMNECYAIIRKQKKIVSLDKVHEEAFVERGFDRIEVKELLSHLTEEDALVLQLFYIKDFTIRDMAHVMEVPENTIKTKLRRAKKRARVQVREEETSWKSGNTY